MKILEWFFIHFTDFVWRDYVESEGNLDMILLDTVLGTFLRRIFGQNV